MSQFRIIHADVMDGLAALPDASFHACFCDPPYGLSFMGKAWDHGVPGPEVWAEVLRVLRPGAPLLAFGGARTYHRLACAIEDAGFSIADTLCWLYGSGFPKGGAQLKPAWEPITLAWKKGKRVLAIDAGRIETDQVRQKDSVRSANNSFGTFVDKGGGARSTGGGACHNLGRWPANVLLDEDAAAALDAQSGHLVSGNNPAVRHSPKTGDVYGFGFGDQCLVHRGTDSGGASRFFYIAKADSAERNAGLYDLPDKPKTHVLGDGLNSATKVRTEEQAQNGVNRGGIKNNHPTVKPIDLCAYLAKLILPGDDARLIVPFSGSGSEIMGALRSGWAECVGIEKEAEYVELSRRRIIGDAPMFNSEATA